MLDLQDVKVGVSNQFASGLLGGYDVTMEQQIYTMAGCYRVINEPVEVDVLGGARYVDAKSTVDTAPSLRGLGCQIRGDVSGWNGIVGVRAIAPVSDKWSLLGHLDVGGGNSTSSWQIIAGASYQYTPTTSMKFGYRVLSYKRNDALLNKVTMGGFYAGLCFKL